MLMISLVKKEKTTCDLDQGILYSVDSVFNDKKDIINFCSGKIKTCWKFMEEGSKGTCFDWNCVSGMNCWCSLLTYRGSKIYDFLL